jgi:hypothetical protein
MAGFFLPIYRKICLGLVSLAFLASAALAQGTVTRIGPITNGDCASFSSPNTIQDGGFPCPGAGGTLNLPNGTTATTQPLNDNTTKVSTDQFVQNQIAAIPPVAPGGTSGQVQFNNAGTFGGLTNTQLTSDINLFTASLSGAVPASGGGTANFLRADGTFAAPPSSAAGSFPQGRLTLTSGTPVMTASVAGATTVYYTSYAGKTVPIYNGSAVAISQLCAANTVGACEISAALGSNWAAGTNYDWFAALDSGTLRLCTGPAWTSQLVRGSGAGTSQLVQLDGLQTNAVSITCRYNNTTTITVPVNQGTYLGTMTTGSAGQTSYVFGAPASGGTAGQFWLWNAYNRVAVTSTVTDNGAFYTYTLATIRQARASAGNQIQFVIGLPSDGIAASYDAETATIAAGASTTIGLGFDSATAISCQSGGLHTPTGATAVRSTTVTACSWNPAIGVHTLSANENSDSSNANQFDNGGTNSLNISMTN